MCVKVCLSLSFFLGLAHVSAQQALYIVIHVVCEVSIPSYRRG